MYILDNFSLDNSPDFSCLLNSLMKSSQEITSNLRSLFVANSISSFSFLFLPSSWATDPLGSLLTLFRRSFSAKMILNTHIQDTNCLTFDRGFNPQWDGRDANNTAPLWCDVKQGHNQGRVSCSLLNQNLDAIDTESALCNRYFVDNFVLTLFRYPYILPLRLFS